MNSFLLFSFSKRDSLTTLFEQTQRIENEGFSKALFIVYDLSDKGYHKEAEELGNLLLNESINSQSLLRQAHSYFLLAYGHKKKNAYKEALFYYEQSLAIREEINDQKSIALIYSNMGNVHYDMGNYAEALSCQKKSLSARLELNDKAGIAQSLGIIGNILSDQKQHQESILYYRKSFNLSLKLNDSLNLSNVLISMGHIKYEMNEYDSAHYYYDRSLAYSLPDNKYSACYAYRGKGSSYIKSEQYDQAEYFIKKSLALAEEIAAPLEITLSQLELAQLYVATGKNEESIKLLQQTLATSQKINFTKGKMLSDKFLSEAYEKVSNFEKALHHHKQFKTLNDSLSLLEEKKIINDLQTQIKIDEETLNLKTAHQAQKNKLLLLSVIPVLFILVLLIYFYYKTATARKEFNLSLKKMEVQAQEHLMFNIHKERKKISQDVHDDLGASITGMQIFTEMIADKTTNPELKNDMNKLLFMQKEITSKVRDVIWFIKNEDDALEGLINYCKNYGENLFSNYPVTTTFSVPENFPYIKILENDRKHFFLAYKEVLNNIIKHSKADKVVIKFEVKNNIFSIQIKDNGKGFNTQSTSSFSYGLKNIKSRINSIDGRVTIESNQNGTLVKFEKDYSDFID